VAGTREDQVWVGADDPTAREETGCFLWVVQQSKVVECYPEVQALTVRCFVITPVGRFVDANDLVSCNVYAQPLRL